MDIELAERVTEARKSGYSDDQIVQYLGKKNPRVAEAVKEGYGSKDIIGHILSSPSEVEAGGKKFKFDSAQNAAGFERGMTGSAVSPEVMAMQYGGKPVAESIPAARQPAAVGGIRRSFSGGAENRAVTRAAASSVVAPFASAADTTLGSITPGVLQQFAYPVERMFKTPEAASATVRQLSAPFEQPFGRAFGVTETPEYKGEASQQLVQFIGENVEKGAKWLSQQIGLPEQDIANMIGNLSLLAGPSISKIPTKLGERAADKAIAASNKSWEDLPRIEATQAAQRHGILLNPAQSNPSKTNTVVGTMAGGPNVNDALSKRNAPRWTQLAKEEMGLPKNSVLEPAAFDKARADLAGPYNRIESIGRIDADGEFLAALDNLGAAETIGGASSDAVAKLAAQAKARAASPFDGALVLQSIKQRRHDAQQTYKRENSASPPSAEELAKADANMKLANALEDLAARNVYDTRFKAELQAARAKMATTYAYERATNFATGKVDPNVIAKLVNADPGRYTGTIKEIGQIAGNFPDIADIKGSTVGIAPRLLRSSPSVVLGTALGSLTGNPLLGAVAGGIAGGIGGNMLRRGIERPGYQKFMGTPADNRLRVDIPEQAPPAVTNNLPAMYDWRNAVMEPETGRPNWVYGQNDFGGVPPDPRFSPPAGPPQLTYDLTGLTSQQRRVYERARDENAERINSLNPTWGPYSPPTTGGVNLQFDPFINKLRPVEPTGAALPVQSELSSAVGKIERGERATLSATEKIAFDKAQANLLIADPAYKSLTPDEIVNRMSDRKSVEATVKKAREKAAGFDEIARRAKDRDAVMLANQNRERMLDFAEDLEDRLRAMPAVKLGQGPKTRAAKTLPPVVVTAKRLPPE